MKKIGKIVGIIFAVLLLIGVLVYAFVLQYPKLKNNPKVEKWYRVTNSDMKTSEGDRYRAFFKKGSENRVLIYFAGGGVSVNEEMAGLDNIDTVVATAVWLPFEEQKQSIAQWLADAIDGNLSDYGVEFIDKKYD